MQLETENLAAPLANARNAGAFGRDERGGQRFDVSTHPPRCDCSNAHCQSDEASCRSTNRVADNVQQALLNPSSPQSRYPWEKTLVALWVLSILAMTAWVLATMIVPFFLRRPWRYNALLIVIGCYALFLAFYSFQIGLGALKWSYLFDRVKDTDFYEKWRDSWYKVPDENSRADSENQAGDVKHWSSVRHFVIVTAYNEELKFLKSVAYTLMAQGRREAGLLPDGFGLDAAADGRLQPPMCAGDLGERASTGSAPDEGHDSPASTTAFCRQHIILVLAMEEREVEASQKVAVLREELGMFFVDIIPTYHPAGLSGEIPGKASNYKWAVTKVEEYVDAHGWCDEDCLVHVADADSLYDPNHFPYVTYDFCTNPERDDCVWQPCMVPTCNFWKLWPGVRQLCTIVTTQEMMSASFGCEFQIPYSTYGLSLKTLRRIGGGSAAHAQDGDVIAEDHHLFIKGFFATRGRLRVQPVHLPAFNFTVEGCECCRACCGRGPGRCCTVEDSRFDQARRHMFAFVELVYFLSLLLRGGWWKRRYSFDLWGALRAACLGLKLFKIHVVGYFGLWVALGVGLTFQAKTLISFCASAYAKKLAAQPIVCDNDIGHDTYSWGAFIFSAGMALGLLGSVFANVAFVKALHQTKHRLDRVARRPREETVERLLSIGDGAPWCGMIVQLTLEQIIFGIVGSLYYGTLPAMVSLWTLVKSGHRMRYVSARRD
eukprot:TRINITY_DN14368_c0_g1_i1.p1 TRINITY_DN14368_c0_g1~~TRINITY_DN14368_c0_g1_i1.p1  ORF type:complete len:716 (-),score=112.42 TRINITY_DN14368_c0_g1_i1:168-2315(-)